jgi:hypothetical protein
MQVHNAGKQPEQKLESKPADDGKHGKRRKKGGKRQRKDQKDQDPAKREEERAKFKSGDRKSREFVKYGEKQQNGQ